MKTLKKLLSVFLTAAMLLSLAPMAMAEIAPTLPSIPTPERIFAVVNDYSLDYGIVMAEQGWIPYTDLDTGEQVNIYDAVSADGRLGDEIKAEIQAMADMYEADGTMSEDIAHNLRSAETLNDLLCFIGNFLYEGTVEMFAELIMMAEAEGMADMVQIIRESEAAFNEKYVDGYSVYMKMADKHFGGNTEPSVEEVICFLAGYDILIDDDGSMYYYDSDFAETPEDTFAVSDIITPTGAFTAPFEMYGGHRNVYEQLRAEWEAGNIDNEEAFAILFGYTPDLNGDLCQVAPEYNTLYDENGLRIKNVLDLVNDDGTVLDSGLSVRDFAIAETLKSYENDDISDIIGSDFDKSYMGFIVNFLYENVPLEEIMGDTGIGEGDEVTEESAAAEIDGFIEFMAPYEEYEGELEETLLTIYGGVEQDLYGYVAMGYTQDYLFDAEGGKVNISDVMAEDGKLLDPEMGESVQALMEELLANMSYDALLKGDVTSDGRVNLSDVSTMLKSIAGWDVEVSADAADTNGDGSTNLSDVSFTLQYIADWDVLMGY